MNNKFEFKWLTNIWKIAINLRTINVTAPKTEKRPHNMSALIFVAAGMAITYTAILYYTGNGQQWAWYHNLVSTLISIILGLFAGFHLYQNQVKDTASRQKQDLVILLQQELSDHYRILSSGERMTISYPGDTIPVMITYIQPLVIEKAAQSGLFGPIETANLLHIARKIHTFNLAENFLITAINSPAANQQQLVKFAARNVDQTSNALLYTDIPKVASQIGFELINMENPGAPLPNPPQVH